jgi:ubiquitin-conjugating enzyme E2 M
MKVKVYLYIYIYIYIYSRFKYWLWIGFYKGGKFRFTFKVNPNYPHDPPKVLCSHKIYHPNIDLEGNVCLNILREDWKPVLNINSILVGLQYLFLEPNADDPLNKGNTYLNSL